MSEERDRDYWFTLERRTSDGESKVSQLQRDYQRDVTQLTHEVKELTNRVNMGLSNSVHDLENENLEIKLAHSELRNQLEKAVQEMRGVVVNSTDLTRLMVSNFAEKDLKPVKTEMDRLTKTFVYGTLGIVIVFFGNKGMNAVWQKIFTEKPRGEMSESLSPPRK